MLRVLSIAHNAVAASNRKRQAALAALPGVQLTLLTPPWWDEEGRRMDVSAAAPWRVGRTLMTGNGTRYVYLSGLVEALRASRPDVIDLYEEPFSLVALQTLVLRDLLAPRAALVFYSAVNIRRYWRRPYRWIERAVFRGADAAHVPNQDVPPILRSKGFLSDRSCAVIPLGVDAERFAKAIPAAGKERDRPRVGFVGRLEPVKGLDVLLDAFSSHVNHPSVELVIAGDGSQREALAAQATTTARRVQMLPPVSYDHMPAFLKSLDVLVLPSVTMPPLHREQFGRVLVEAMAAGVPVIGSTSGAIPEVIGDAGLVVRERDAAALGRAIDRLLDQPELRQTLVERGMQRVEQNFAWPVVADKTVVLFEAAVAHRQRSRARPQVVSA